MFIAYCSVLLLLVYSAPALALYPRLILSSRNVVAIPFISIAIIAVLQWILATIGGYNHLIVICSSIVLLLIAVVRIALLFRNTTSLVFYWPNTHRLLLIFSLLLGIYWAGLLGSSGFDTDDEIYSWNMWAIQHYQNEAIDFSFTGAPYPQLFSILISFCYKLLGSLELQLPVKALFAVFPMALWGSIAVAPKEASVANAIRSFLIMLFLFAAVGNYFGIGLADPMMAASIVVSIYFFIEYKANPLHSELLAFSVVCAAVALYTKQGGLIWALFSLPVIAIIATWRRQLPPIILAGAAILFIIGLIWVFGAGSGFQNNQGVVAASRQGRGILEQLIFAIKKHSTEQPLVPLLLAVGIYSVVRARRHMDILICFLLPALFAWLLYGAYSLRHGLHIVSLSALLLAACNYPLPAIFGGGAWTRTEHFLNRYALFCAIAVSLIIATATIHKINKHLEIYGSQFSPYIAGKNTLAKYYGNDAEFIFNEIYDHPDLLLWVPSNYVYGVFYNHTPMMRPDYHKNKSPYDTAMLLEEIKLRRPNYLFDTGQIDQNLATVVLRKLAEQQCPAIFERLTGQNKYSYVIYRLHYDNTLVDKCMKTLQH
jgi:hypothetical protein